MSKKKGYKRAVSLEELKADESLLRAMPSELGIQPATLIERALFRASQRGILAYVIVRIGDSRQPVFRLNSESDRTALEEIAEEPPRWLGMYQDPPDLSVERPNVFEMYEQHIGMMSPMIADALLEAEDMYPEAWIEDAISEAVENNARSWRYISRILERWERDGKGQREFGGRRREF